MKKNKLLSLILGIEGLNVPLAVLYAIILLITSGNLGIIFSQSVLVGVIVIIELLLHLTYTVTFIYSAHHSLLDDEISIVTFFPLFHFLLIVFIHFLKNYAEIRYMI